MTHSPEHVEQSLLFQWIGHALHRTPELDLAYAIPNWIGPRTARHGAYLKAEGRRAGVPDVCLPVPRGDYGALYVEMKAGKNKPTPQQREWHQKLEQAGNRVVVCWSWEEARDAMLAYLALPKRAAMSETAGAA